MTPKQQLDSFLAKYDPEIAALGRRILGKMRRRLPGAVEIVYDNYNALVIGFGPTERPSEAVFSIALYPRWINLFFLDGAVLPDPHGRLKGSGNQVRSVRLETAALLDDPQIVALMKDAVQLADVPFDSGQKRKMVIRMISKKQRPRKPI